MSAMTKWDQCLCGPRTACTGFLYFLNILLDIPSKRVIVVIEQIKTSKEVA